jgi:putative transcriptional regulator
MTKAGERPLRAVDGARAIARGEADPKTYRVHLPKEIDARLIRKRLKMTQAAFAETYGLDLRTLQDWEQKRRIPTGPSRVLLTVISREPEAIRRALAG